MFSYIFQSELILVHYGWFWGLDFEVLNDDVQKLQYAMRIWQAMIEELQCRRVI